MLAKTKTRQNKTKKQHRKPDKQLTFLDHLHELRSRLFWIVLTLIVGASVAFTLKDPLIAFITAPMSGQHLIFLTVGGGFSFIFNICLYVGAIFTIPVFVYHLYRFIQPVIESPSRKLIISLVIASGSLAIAGAAFGYFFAIRASLEFLLNFAGGTINSSVTAESYLNFIVMYTAGLAAAFQLPLLLYVFDHIKPFPPGALLSSQRYVIVGAVIVAALITPTPDVVNQMIVAIPIIAIYQFGAIAVYIRHKLIQHGTRKGVLDVPIDPVFESSFDFDALMEKPQVLPVPDPAPVIRASAPIVVAPRPVESPVLRIQPRSLPQPRRTMEGFVSARPQVVMPQQRVVEAPKPTPQPLQQVLPAASRPQRFKKVSIDGFSMV